MAERSKALRSGRSPLLWAWVRIPLLTIVFIATEMIFTDDVETGILIFNCISLLIEGKF